MNDGRWLDRLFIAFSAIRAKYLLIWKLRYSGDFCWWRKSGMVWTLYYVPNIVFSISETIHFIMFEFGWKGKDMLLIERKGMKMGFKRILIHSIDHFVYPLLKKALEQKMRKCLKQREKERVSDLSTVFDLNIQKWILRTNKS